MDSKHSQEERDAFTEGFHGIPSAARRQSMSDSELAAELASAEHGSAKYIALDLELSRRKQAKQQDAKPAPDHWYKRPVAVVCLSLLSALLVVCVLHLFQKHFGISLR